MNAKFLSLDVIQLSCDSCNAEERLLFERFVKLIASNKAKIKHNGIASTGGQYTHIQVQLDFANEGEGE